MKKNTIYLLTFILIVLTACKTKKEQVDLIVHNAKIYTVNDSMQIVESFAIKDGKFIAIGSNDEIMKKYNSEKTIDLKGKIVFPGFYDAHCHFDGYGMFLQNANLVNTTSFEEILDILIKHNKKCKPQWIVGRGWDQNDWETKEFPDKKELDSIFPDTPVLLTRIDGHAVLVNSEAIKRAKLNFDKYSKNEIVFKNGEFTGILLENAADYMKSKVPEANLTQKKRALLDAQKDCFAVGLTSIVDAGLSKDWINLIDSLNKSGELKIRIYAMLLVTDENIEKMNEGKYKTDYLNVRSMKLFSDGALGSRGACLKEPYTDDTANYGIITESYDYYLEKCKLAYKLGFQVNTHAIGDSAVRMMLDIYASVLKGKNDLRWRIEHSQVVNLNDFHLYGDYNIIPSIQTTHATSDMYWAETRLGAERIKGAYAYKKLLEQNGWLPNGSDFPIEDINPLFGFYAGVARKDQKGFPENGFQAENALTREQALKAMTIWAAKSCFEENEKGSIEAGKIADFVVLENDIMIIPENELFKAKVLMTFLGGEKVFGVEN